MRGGHLQLVLVAIARNARWPGMFQFYPMYQITVPPIASVIFHLKEPMDPTFKEKERSQETN